jgi:hypothetical protein
MKQSLCNAAPERFDERQGKEKLSAAFDKDPNRLHGGAGGVENFLVRTFVDIGVPQVIDCMAESFERAALFPCDDSTVPCLSKVRGDFRKRRDAEKRIAPCIKSRFRMSSGGALASAFRIRKRLESESWGIRHRKCLSRSASPIAKGPARKNGGKSPGESQNGR